MIYKYFARQLANKVLKEIEEEKGKIDFPINPFELLKKHNIIITFSDFEKLEGIILNDEDNVTIVGINRLRPWTRQRFTAAHEYCHFIKDLKKDKSEINRIDCLMGATSQVEKFADEFASHLLMPTYKLQELCNKYKNEQGYIDFENITIIAEFFGVSFKSCLTRIAYELKMIEGDISSKELEKRTNYYKPDKKRRELIEKNNDLKLINNVINNLSYCMIDLNKIIGIKFLNNYIYYDNKLEGIEQKNVPFILADLNYNKDKSKFYNTEDENIIMTLGNYKLQEYVLTTQEKFSFSCCKKLHQLLFSYTKYPEYAGFYRNNDAVIKRGTIQPINYLEINDSIKKLDIKFKKIYKEIDDLCISDYIEKVVPLVYEFIVIHPFNDGNGRISRAILNWLLCLKKIPPIYIDDKSRKEYYSALSQIDLNNNYEDFIMLIEKRIINTMTELHNYLFIEDAKN